MDLINYRKLVLMLLLSSYTYLSSMEIGIVDNTAIAVQQNLSIKDRVIKWVKEHKPQTAIIASLAIAGIATGGYFAIKHFTKDNVDDLKDPKKMQQLLNDPKALNIALQDPKVLEIILNSKIDWSVPVNNVENPISDEKNLESFFNKFQRYAPMLEATKRLVEQRKKELQQFETMYKDSSDLSDDIKDELRKSPLIPHDVSGGYRLNDYYNSALAKYDENINKIDQALKNLSNKDKFKQGYDEDTKKYTDIPERLKFASYHNSISGLIKKFQYEFKLDTNTSEIIERYIKNKNEKK